MEYFDFLGMAVLAVAVGGLIGLEREKMKHALVGIRSFALLSLFGLIVVSSAGLIGAAIGLGGILVLASYYYHAKHETMPSTPGVTTALMIPFVFILGVLVGIGKGFEAGIASIIATALLVERTKVHEIASGISKREIVDVVIFAIIAFIVFPILPKQPITIEGVVVDLTFFWSIVVIVNGIGLAGYASSKYFKSKGTELAVFFSGVVSSLATVLVYSKENSNSKTVKTIFALAFLGALAGDVALLSIVSREMLLKILPLFTLLIIGCAWMIYKNKEKKIEIKAGRKELSIGFAVEFAIVFFLVTILLTNTFYGSIGWLSAIVGGILSSTSVIAASANVYTQTNASATVWNVFFAVLGSTVAKAAVILRNNKKINEIIEPIAIITIFGVIGAIISTAL